VTVRKPGIGKSELLLADLPATPTFKPLNLKIQKRPLRSDGNRPKAHGKRSSKDDIPAPADRTTNLPLFALDRKDDRPSHNRKSLTISQDAAFDRKEVGMLYLLDTADLAAIRRSNDLYPIAGVTTNPTIITREKTEFLPRIREIHNIIGEKAMLHVHALSKVADKIVVEAKYLNEKIG